MRKLGKTGFEFSDNLAWGRGRSATLLVHGKPSICVLPALNYFVETRAGCDNELAESHLPPKCLSEQE